MISQYTGLLATKSVVLASGSPRRREILDLLGLPFRVHVSGFEETLDKSAFGSAREYAETNATCKARDVAVAEGDAADLVIGCDTIVVIDGQILEKPSSEGNALHMLQKLSGRSHTVISSVAIFVKGNSVKPELLFSEQTTVWFATISDEAIHAYIRTGEPMDKGKVYLYTIMLDVFCYLRRADRAPWISRANVHAPMNMYLTLGAIVCMWLSISCLVSIERHQILLELTADATVIYSLLCSFDLTMSCRCLHVAGAYGIQGRGGAFVQKVCAL
jgi:septum formation protein